MKSVLVNPTQYWIFPSLEYYDSSKNETKIINFNGNTQTKNSTVVQPYNVITEGAEMEQGIKVRISFSLN